MRTLYAIILTAAAVSFEECIASNHQEHSPEPTGQVEVLAEADAFEGSPESDDICELRIRDSYRDPIKFVIHFIKDIDDIHIRRSERDPLSLAPLAFARDSRNPHHLTRNPTTTFYRGNATAVYPRTSGHGTVYRDRMSYNTIYPDYNSYYNATTTTTSRRHAFDSNTTAEPTVTA
jgi:hypothetical protein